MIYLIRPHWSKGGDRITDIFSSLDPAKQSKILNAAYEEFAEYGFKKASTNRIVKNAGIGKGMLFYYFKSKQELYYYLIDYGITFLVEEYFTLIDSTITDFFEKYKQAGQVKMQAYAKYPHIFNFIASVYINEEIELPADLYARLEELKALGYKKLYSNIDNSVFRTDIELSKLYQIIHWTLEGYEKNLTDQLKGKKLSSINFDPYWDEFFEIINILKKLYYKEEGY